MRLIDADALKEHTEIVSYKNGWYETEIDEFVSVENIDSAPSIDIVRCGECRHRITGIMGKMCIGRHPDDYCSYGEREGE